MRFVISLLLILLVTPAFAKNKIVVKRGAILNYSQFLALSHKQKRAYVKGVRRVLQKMSARSRFVSDFHFTNLFLSLAWAEEAPPDAEPKIRCMYGGFILKSRSASSPCKPLTESILIDPNNSKNSLKFSCAKDKALCNPLLYGNTDENKPICTSELKETTKACNALANKHNTLDRAIALILKNPKDWEQFKQDIQGLCNEGHFGVLKGVLDRPHSKRDIVQTCKEAEDRLSALNQELSKINSPFNLANSDQEDKGSAPAVEDLPLEIVEVKAAPIDKYNGKTLCQKCYVNRVTAANKNPIGERGRNCYLKVDPHGEITFDFNVENDKVYDKSSYRNAAMSSADFRSCEPASKCRGLNKMIFGHYGQDEVSLIFNDNKPKENCQFYFSKRPDTLDYSGSFISEPLKKAISWYLSPPGLRTPGPAKPSSGGRSRAIGY